MSAKFYAILTDLGAAKLANATALGTSLEITTMAVGDGGGTVPTPTASQTALIGEKRRAPLNSINIDPNNPNQIITEQIIPEDVGGWWIREIGLFDKDGILIAVANCPDTYKPQLSEGSGRTQAVRMIIIVSNTAAITLKIDPSVVLATRKYVEQSIIEHEKTLKHPDATLSTKGFVQLNSAVNSSSTTQAATPSAIKQAYDLAASKLSSVPAASTSASGIVKLNSATNSVLETEAATPKAVKIAYDLASSKLSSVPVASTSQAGIVQLNGTVNSTSTTQAATPNAVKQAYDLATTANTTANNAVTKETTINNKKLDTNILITSQDIFDTHVIHIGAGANLDDYMTAGTYAQTANANAQSGLNYPEGSAGALIVHRSATPGATQIYYVYNSSRKYIRGKYGTSDWSPWALEFNTENVPSLAQLGINRNTASKAANGWWRCGDTGVIKQWGIAAAADNNVVTANLPIAFPNAAQSLNITVNSSVANTADQVMSAYGTIVSKSQIKIALCTNWANGAGYVFFEVMGY